jgi:hypothetical protein
VRMPDMMPPAATMSMLREVSVEAIARVNVQLHL